MQLHWLAIESPGSSVSACLCSAGIIDTYHCVQLFIWFLEIYIWVLMLQAKHFPSWVISRILNMENVCSFHFLLCLSVCLPACLSVCLSDSLFELFLAGIFEVRQPAKMAELERVKISFSDFIVDYMNCLVPTYLCTLG